MLSQPSSYSCVKPASRNTAQASSSVTFFMRSRMASGTFGRPSAKRSPFQSGVYLIRSSLVKIPGWPNASPAAHSVNNRAFIVS